MLRKEDVLQLPLHSEVTTCNSPWSQDRHSTPKKERRDGCLNDLLHWLYCLESVSISIINTI